MPGPGLRRRLPRNTLRRNTLRRNTLRRNTLRRAKAAALLSAGLLLATAGAANANWSASTANNGAAKALTVGPGNAPSTTVSGRSVTATWPASTYSNSATIGSYLVTRYDGSGSVPQTITTGSCATLVAGTACTETGVPAGTWTYSVTPAVGAWRGVESAKVAATVAAPSLSLSPTLTRAGGSLSGTAGGFIPGDTLTFQLDSVTGTFVPGSLGGAATPAAVDGTGGGAVTVTLPAGTSEGMHTVYAVASPSGDSATQTVTVDNTPPPTPTITGGPSGATTATSATFTFSDTEAGVTFGCSLDGGATTTCAGPTSYGSLSDGPHTFAVTATDTVGNTSGAATRTWTVDTTAPSTTITFPVGGGSYNDSGYDAGCGTAAVGDLCGTTSDVGSGVATVRVSLQQATSGRWWNGTSFGSVTEVLLTPAGTTSWTYPIARGSLTDGSYTLRVYATDAVGNARTSVSTFVRDTAAPTNVITFPSNGSSLGIASYNAGCSTAAGDVCGTASGLPTVKVSIQQASSGRYWDGSAFASSSLVQIPATGSASWSYALAAGAFSDGSYTLRSYATDAANNTSTATSTFTIDATPPPAPTFSATPPASSSSSSATFQFADTEAGVALTCSLDGAAPTTCTSPLTFQPIANGSHTFAVTATDAAGNRTSATYAWTSTAPANGGSQVFPVNGGVYRTSTYNNGCATAAGDICGTAGPGGTGALVSIRRASTGSYWNGTAFAAAAETFVTANGASWNVPLALASMPDGDYTIRFLVVASGGGTSLPSAATTYSIDTVAPTGVAVSTTNAGTNGRPEKGDTVVFTTSETLLPGSVLTGWTGASTSVVVRITDGGGPGDDVLTVYNAANSTPVALGSLGLGQKDFVRASVTFGATGTPSTMVQSGSTVTITLGTVDDATLLDTAKKAGNMTWTPSASATDPAGNPMVAAPVVETDNDKDL